MRYWQQGTVHQPQLTYFKVLLLMTLVEDGPRKRHWIIIILWRKILRLSLFIRCQSQCNYHKNTHTFVGIIYFLICRDHKRGKQIWEVASYEYFIFQGAERWGRPHLSSLSFHSLINLRLALEKAVLILDFDHARDFTTIAFKVNKYATFLILPYPCL